MVRSPNQSRALQFRRHVIGPPGNTISFHRKKKMWPKTNLADLLLILNSQVKSSLRSKYHMELEVMTTCLQQFHARMIMVLRHLGTLNIHGYTLRHSCCCKKLKSDTSIERKGIHLHITTVDYFFYYASTLYLITGMAAMLTIKKKGNQQKRTT